MSDKVNAALGKIFSLEGKVVLLTGAAGGIGSELGKGLASAGAMVCLCDVNESGLKKVEEEIHAGGDLACSYILNVMDLKSINSCVDEIIKDHKKIDVLINCAGVNRRIGGLDATEEIYDRIMNINLKGVFFLSQAVAKHMVEQKSGNIINVASHNSVSMLGGCGIYGASKSGIAALTRAQAVEWAKHGIRSNAIAPGHIKTELTAPTWQDPDRAAYLTERIAMGRPGTPEELVGLTILLASDASSYMSGMLYHVDGGCLAGGQPWTYETKY